MLVPPVCIRPSVQLDAAQGSSEDDLTVQLSQIVQMSNECEKQIEKGGTVAQLMENWDCT